VYAEFPEGGGNLGKLSDLATVILAEAEHSRDELRQPLREDALPVRISFNEGNDISVFAYGRSNVSDARQWRSMRLHALSTSACII